MKGPPAPTPRYPSLGSALAAAAASEYGLTFVDARERYTPLSWREVYQRARRMASGLISLGIRPGDRVAIVLPTAPSFTDAFFGALLAGAVPVPLYPPVRLGRLEEYQLSTGRMLSAVGARVLLSDQRIRLLLGRAVQRAWPQLGVRTTADVAELAAGEEALDAEPDALALIQFSSGSTVEPKPVALTHRNLVSQCMALQLLMPELPPEQRGVSWLPLYHDMGLIGCLLSAACYPGPLTLIPPEVFIARPAIWLRTLSKERGTISPAPNFAYSLCLKRVTDEELDGVDLSSWRYALNGAESVSTEVMGRFAERFARWGFDARALMPVYGLAEASLAVTFTPRRSPPRALGVDPQALATRGEVVEGGRQVASVGTPVPGFEVEVRGEDGQACPDRRVGKIFARGPSVMRGYFEQPDPSAQALVNGWLDTGDLGFTAEGELYVCGRAKDVIIIRGANHQPQEFEDCVNGLAGVRTGCSVALGYTPEGGDGEELLILAEVTSQDHAAVEERIRTAVLEKTGVRPHLVKLLPPGTLPRTSSGKLRRREALRQFIAGELRPPNAAGALQLAGEVAKSAIAYAKVKLSEE